MKMLMSSRWFQADVARWIGIAAFAMTACAGDDVTPGGTAGTAVTAGTAGAAGSGGSSGSSGAAGAGGTNGGTDADGPLCGGFAGLTCPRPLEEYCDYEDTAACGNGDQLGTCRARPDLCTKDCPGVCGCDGQHYCNACEAYKAGIDVSTTPCP